jgi:hypothetical protein
MTADLTSGSSSMTSTRAMERTVRHSPLIAALLAMCGG